MAEALPSPKSPKGEGQAEVQAEVQAEEQEQNAATTTTTNTTTHSWRFWLVIASLCCISFISAVDVTIVTTSLPTITRSVRGESKYVWIANCFALAATAIQPFVGQVSNIFGRRNPMLTSIALFGIGSGIAGGAKNVGALIAGRTIQGLGSGGLMVLMELILCDIVPLRQRGSYLGFMLSTSAVGTTIGPIVGGALAQADWRWIFWLNIPVSGISFLVMFFYLNVTRTRDPTWKHSLARVDFLGNAIFIPSAVAVLLGLILGGVTFAWNTYHIIVALVVGFIGLIVFQILQATPLCPEPSVPPRLFRHRTAAMGFVINFLSSVLLEWVVYYLPLYFLGAKGTSALDAGVNFLPYTIFVVPFGMMSGVFMTKSGLFKPQHWAGFAFSCIGCGLLSTLTPSSPKVAWVCYQILAAAGTGFIMSSTLPATLAPLAEKDVATATGTFSFIRSFGYIWGITLPGIIFNAQFDRYSYRISDPVVRNQLAHGAAYGFASNGFIQSLSGQVRSEVTHVYAAALKTVWEVAVAFAGLGFLCVFFEKHVPLREELNTEFGLDEGREKKPLDISLEEGASKGTATVA
jgi:MFS family permease